MVAAGLILMTLVLVVRNQVKVYQNRQERVAWMAARHPAVPVPPEVQQRRNALFEMLRPVALTNCDLQRFGEANDGGYLICGNLLDAVQSGYSYGIGGYDQWGCDISTKLTVPVHQYDCFETTRPACSSGNTVFHEECVGDASEIIEGRTFDTIANQLAKNGDTSGRLVMKIDVEGAEWGSLMAIPDGLLQRIDQLAIEFHWGEDEQYRWVDDEKYLKVVERLKQFFEVGHLHANNASCVADLAPFTSWAFEVLFVSKRLAVVDRARTAGGLHPLDARNNPGAADCQPALR
jgi:hypothetical protein